MSTTRGTLLVVEDDLGLQKQLRWSFEGYDVQIAGDRETAVTQLRRFEPPVVLLDLGLPPDPDSASEGLATLEQILALSPATKVIVVTGNQDRANAVKAIGMGAFDFYQKPFDSEILGMIVARAFRVQELERENHSLLSRQSESPMKGIVSADPQMLKLCRTVEKVAPSDATVLLLGESGTGKELLARAVQQLSTRQRRLTAPYICPTGHAIFRPDIFSRWPPSLPRSQQRHRGSGTGSDAQPEFHQRRGERPLRSWRHFQF